jgi:hypothetical protein
LFSFDNRSFCPLTVTVFKIGYVHIKIIVALWKHLTYRQLS